MSKRKLVYFGHSYHEKTGSSGFFLDLLREHFEVATVSDEGWLTGRPHVGAESINVERPDLVVFYQQILPQRQLRRVQCRNQTWVVMHDAVNYRSSQYRKYAGGRVKSLHFSGVSAAIFRGLGFETHQVQYFPAPAPVVPRSGGATPSLFFWIRRSDLSWAVVKTLLGRFRPARIVLRYFPDPGCEPPPLPPPEDIREYRIELHREWMDRDRYLELMKSCDLFVAPRRLEGIGMASLEAMAHGLCVIAPDAPTMNEYIRHGENGIVYDPDRPAPLAFDRWQELGVRARQTIEAGRPRWLQSQQSIVEFLRRGSTRPEGALWRLYRALGR